MSPVPRDFLALLVVLEGGERGEGGRSRGWFKNGEDRFRSRRNSAEIFWRFLNSKIICGILILTLLFQEDWVEEV